MKKVTYKENAVEAVLPLCLNDQAKLLETYTNVIIWEFNHKLKDGTMFFQDKDHHKKHDLLMPTGCAILRTQLERFIQPVAV